MVLLVLIKDTITGEDYEHKCDGVFLGIGHKPNSDLFKNSLKSKVVIDSEITIKGLIKILKNKNNLKLL